MRGHQLLLRESFRLVCLVCVLSLLWGCAAKIGDGCRTDANCSQLGDRVCDTSQLQGYCTQANCSPTSCPPGEGICVVFNDALSRANACQDYSVPSPYARSFCMKPCSRNEDCRPGYECIELAGADPWSAEVIQESPQSTRVCIVPQSGAPVDVDALSDVPENVCSFPSNGGASGEGGGAGAGSVSAGGASEGG